MQIGLHTGTHTGTGLHTGTHTGIGLITGLKQYFIGAQHPKLLPKFIKCTLLRDLLK